MKIIDFEKYGNVVKLYLGADDCEDYRGDDWDDTPYEHNAGLVYPEFITGTREIAFPTDYLVLEPASGEVNSRFCKDDMKDRNVPCIVVYKRDDYSGWDETYAAIVGADKAIRFYFGDKMEPSDKLEVWQPKEEE